VDAIASEPVSASKAYLSGIASSPNRKRQNASRKSGCPAPGLPSVFRFGYVRPTEPFSASYPARSLEARDGSDYCNQLLRLNSCIPHDLSPLRRVGNNTLLQFNGA
jgi:hypothetical protein